jgi:hypothetical protein
MRHSKYQDILSDIKNKTGLTQAVVLEKVYKNGTCYS